VTPLEVSAEILKVLKARAERALGSTLDGVVITVPAYFDDGSARRRATRAARGPRGVAVAERADGGGAGLRLTSRSRDVRRVRLGGGTFDVSILKLEAGVFEVKATGGDSPGR